MEFPTLFVDHTRPVVAVQAGQEKVDPEKGKEKDAEADDGEDRSVLSSPASG
jgi:hypothetical protein